MKMYDIIVKKRNGKSLTEDEIRYLVNGYVKGEIPDYQMSAFLMTLYFQNMNEDEIFYLTDAMLESGNTLDWSGVEGITVDKHSTGGVGDKISIISGPVAAAVGCKVVKMSGRGLGFTGGTIDKLTAIPGFNTDISLEEFQKNVKTVGFSLISQRDDIVKADKLIYALRDVTATVDTIPLIASSIMSKKLASNADAIVLDIKYGDGALMKLLKNAHNLGDVMKNIAERKGKKVQLVYSDMSEPLGMEIGNRNEIIEAIEVLKGNIKGRLFEESIEIASRMICLCNLSKNAEEGRKLAEETIENGMALKKFKDFIKAQGGNQEVVEDYDIMKNPKYSRDVRGKQLSEIDDVIEKISAEKIGIASVKTGAGRSAKDDLIDFSAGVTLRKKTGDSFEKNDIIATLWGNDPEKLKDAESYVIDAFKTGKFKNSFD
ncbi:MAG: thymidine phosphorylase [[Eubacterium] brachy]|nr:putative pyrimidine-nucleoside phosphorylase [Eubacterium brachy ATCC 33089]MBF1134761.1 thymidine phosphorylase [[Eubacterium] brachy]